MFSENLKELRKQKGLTQNELAIRVHVVRQTVSKWEKGLSVPDADTLVKIAAVFDVPVSQLLGAKIESESDMDKLAEQLARINEQLAVRNRRAHFIWKIVGIVLLVLSVVYLLMISILVPVACNSYLVETEMGVTEIVEQEAEVEYGTEY